MDCNGAIDLDGDVKEPTLDWIGDFNLDGNSNVEAVPEWREKSDLEPVDLDLDWGLVGAGCRHASFVEAVPEVRENKAVPCHRGLSSS